MARPNLFFVAVSMLGSGCTSVNRTLPSTEYRSLSSTESYSITTRDGAMYHGHFESFDSTVVLRKHRQHNTSPETSTLVFRYRDITSVTSTETHLALQLETGAEYGKNFGAASHNYAAWRAIVEFTSIPSETRVEKPRVGNGASLYFACAEASTRMGLKARARYHVNPKTSFDVFAGPMLTDFHDGFFNGFVGGVSVNVSSFLTVRSEYVAYRAPEWTQRGDGAPIVHPEGYEQVWYNGAALTW